MKIELSGHYGYGRLLRTMVPCAAMMAVTSVYTLVDGLFVSNFAGSTAFAGMNIIWPVISIFSVLGLMLGTGGSALVSKTFGQGKDKKACEIFTMLVKLSLIIGVLSALVLYATMQPLAIALGAEGQMIECAVSYGRILCYALPFYTVNMLFQSFYMTAEKPQLGTIISIICAVSNIGLDALFVVVFGWGLRGAAYATVVTVAISGLFPLIWFASDRNTTHLVYVKSEYDWRAIGKSASNGLSEYVGNIALNVVSICYNLQLMKYIGEDGVSAYGIIMFLGFLFASVFIGYNISVSQVAAYNYGAENKAEIHSLFVKSSVIVGVLGITITSAMLLASRPLASLFIGYDKQLLDLSTHAIRIYMLSFLLCGFNMFTSAWFTAFGNGLISAIAAFTRTLVFELAAVFILPALFGMDGIWFSVDVAEALAFILAVILLLAYRKRYGY